MAKALKINVPQVNSKFPLDDLVLELDEATTAVMLVVFETTLFKLAVTVILLTPTGSVDTLLVAIVDNPELGTTYPLEEKVADETELELDDCKILFAETEALADPLADPLAD